MSFLPYDADDCCRPSRILDQQFGLPLKLEDVVAPVTTLVRPSQASMHLRPSRDYIRPWRTAQSERDHGSILVIDKDKFQASLDVQQFPPEGLIVTVTGNNTITVEGRQDEKEDGHSIVARQFMRKYVLPIDCDYGNIESKISTDGVLTITAPRIKPHENEECRKIGIVQTGKPAEFDEEIYKRADKRCVIKEDKKDDEIEDEGDDKKEDEGDDKKEDEKDAKKGRKKKHTRARRTSSRNRDQISPIPDIIVGPFPIGP